MTMMTMNTRALMTAIRITAVLDRTRPLETSTSPFPVPSLVFPPLLVVLLSQRAPCHPGAHEQTAPCAISWHVAPFRHGLREVAHGLSAVRMTKKCVMRVCGVRSVHGV